MKKTIRLTESDLTRIVKRVIKEQSTQGKNYHQVLSEFGLDENSLEQLVNIQQSIVKNAEIGAQDYEQATSQMLLAMAEFDIKVAMAMAKYLTDEGFEMDFILMP
jgi:alpha-N-acetylglucosamine transferase